jgi:hypothetical protein
LLFDGKTIKQETDMVNEKGRGKRKEMEGVF